MTVAGIAAAILLAWVGTMAGVMIASLLGADEKADLLARKAAVESAESRVAQYRGNLDAVAGDLQKRQDFIEKMVESTLGDLPQGQDPAGTVSDSTDEAGKAVKKISALVPEARGLAQLEARQIAFVERLTRAADARSAQAEAALRKVGLNPGMMLASANGRDAQGGPLIPLLTGRGKIDPRFERLGASLSRMEALERGLAALPSTLPASLQYISSGFGYRADPFTGGAAFHAGLDFRGPVGAPIYAAAPGTVSFAGVRQGYGNCVEISHAGGLVTRYAHMSRIGASVGQKVAAGAQIGQIGNTGRSTGPHLHFEVRVNDQPVNPRPFLEGVPHVFQEARAGRPAPRG
jgi:murein DD-endopeptidase MepM/ murein hydrolase activator NlpD